MISYTNGGAYQLLRLCQMKGSVFPRAAAVAVPCATIACVLRLLINEGHLSVFEAQDSIMTQTQAWAGFSTIVGFFLIFRTSQAHGRFWDGCTSTHRMRAEWFDACSAIIAFCQFSKVEQEKVQRFKHTLVRLFSMLHASALADLEDLNNAGKEDDVSAFTYELIDPFGIDAVSLSQLRTTDARVELIFEWIQILIVKNIETGVLSIPPPILSRAFQEIANGMVAFHDSVKISYIPFPFPYAQNCDFILLLHWLLAPFVFAHWVTQPVWAFLFVFVQVFFLWSLNFIAVEIENPFGNDMNDIDAHHMQCEMNRHLILLLKPSTLVVPTLSEMAIWTEEPGTDRLAEKLELARSSFVQVWSMQGVPDDEPIGRKESFVYRRRNSADRLSQLQKRATVTRQDLPAPTSLQGSWEVMPPSSAPGRSDGTKPAVAAAGGVHLQGPSSASASSFADSDDAFYAGTEGGSHPPPASARKSPRSIQGSDGPRRPQACAAEGDPPPQTALVLEETLSGFTM